MTAHAGTNIYGCCSKTIIFAMGMPAHGRSVLRICTTSARDNRVRCTSLSIRDSGTAGAMTAFFLQDSLAIMVIERLLEQIELMKQQHISLLEQINYTFKCKFSTFEELTIKVKWAKYQPISLVKPL